MRAASGEPRAVAAEEPGGDVRGQGAAGGEPCKKVVYVEPSRRVKEILEEELAFRKEVCHVKHPAAAALEGIWSVKKNFSLGSLKPVSQNRNGLLLQPQFYSRHAGMKSGECWFHVHNEPYLPFLTSNLNKFKSLEKLSSSTPPERRWIISGSLAFARNGQLVLWGSYFCLYGLWNAAFVDQNCSLRAFGF